MILYKIENDLQQKCYDFALKCVLTNQDEYSRRNQTNKQKIIEDIKIGKIGEFAAKSYLETYSKSQISKPNLKIYLAKNKKHDYDLVDLYDNFNFSVKTQRLEDIKKYGKSVLFQKNYIDRIKNKYSKNHNLIYCLHDSENKFIIIDKELGFGDIFNMLEEPKLDKLKGNKYAIYFRD